jgi:UDP-3-O-[3-hydroxymyristoyl] N-acetylglucosamine deacetylase
MQRTLARVVRAAGIGLHTGKEIQMALYPAPEDSGIIFICNRVQIPAIVSNVSITKLATTLSNGNTSIITVEHLLAALHGKRIHNCFIHLDEPEVPVMDGSVEPFVQLIEEAGVVLQSVPRKVLKVKKNVRIDNEDSLVEIRPFDGLRIECDINYDHPLIGNQIFVFDRCKDSFVNAISYARTFGFEKDVEEMQVNGFALGGSVENAIVLTEDGMLNEEPLRYEDEFVRHKILDILGDLYLSGYEIEGDFYGYKSGHSLNIELVKKLLSDGSNYALVNR